MARITFVVGNRLSKRMRVSAAQDGLSLSELIRSAVVEKIKGR